jgi:sugar O-acyltransferase (sialic acid O-acetyltransferase NeuD family)
MTKKVIILGGQGDGGSIGQAIVDANRRGDTEWEFSGFLNDRLETGSTFEGIPILGNLCDVKKYFDEGYYFIYTIYRIDGQKKRLSLFESLGIPDERLATFVHPTAYIASNVHLSPGCVVMPYVCISPQTTFGKCCIMLQSCTIGHNNVISDNVHISAQACVGGYLNIGKGAHIGMNSSIRENVTIGDYATLGGGSMLLTDIPEGQIWAGSPARFIRMANEDD